MTIRRAAVAERLRSPRGRRDRGSDLAWRQVRGRGRRAEPLSSPQDLIIDQARPRTASSTNPFEIHLSIWPVSGSGARLVMLRRPSRSRGEYDKAGGAGANNISSGFEQPRPAVDDLRAMTYNTSLTQPSTRT